MQVEREESTVGAIAAGTFFEKKDDGTKWLRTAEVVAGDVKCARFDNGTTTNLNPGTVAYPCVSAKVVWS